MHRGTYSKVSSQYTNVRELFWAASSQPFPGVKFAQTRAGGAWPAEPGKRKMGVQSPVQHPTPRRASPVKPEGWAKSR